MNKLIAITILAIIILNTATAQHSMPDVNRLMKMLPAERQKYADSLKNALTGDITQPDLAIQPPPKDLPRLSMIRAKPPTRTELVQQVQKSQSQLQSVLPKTEVEEVKKFAAENNVEAMHGAAIADFYSNQPEKALWLMMQAAQQQPDSVVVWNNLGAMYNLAGLQHRAVPMLQYCLQHEPGSSMVLNNLGQSFLGLGELVKARQYLQQCLAIDSLNPDANHSMGLIHLYAKEVDAAMRCFERELSVAMRMSTYALAVKNGKKINLRALKEKRDAMNKRPQKDYFSEIHLTKFKLLTYPSTVKEAYEQVADYSTIASSIQEEIQFWNSVGYLNKKEIIEDGKSRHGIYHELVKVLLDELHEEFDLEYLANTTEKDTEIAIDINNMYEKKLREIQCLKPPPGSTLEVQEAYEAKCCIKFHQPLRNMKMMELASHWYPKMKASHLRWKSYINQLISIVALDPSPGNKLMVYKAVAAYFSAMGIAMLYSGTAEAVKGTLPICDTSYNEDKADSVIEANRKWELSCPAWLNVEIDVEVGKIKADCNKYAVEFGKSIMGGYEYEFKTGRSTLLAGYGVKGKFLANTAKAGIQQMLYLTFDDNGFADFGTRFKADAGFGDTPFTAGPVKFGGTLAGVEGSWQLGMNSGFTSKVVGKGVLADFIKIDKSL
ncbi:MAG TPA: hypothetical protein VD996_18355 [Chitinophagaceae bacterium]|nr:hypothetical protein [Chitinophagaceae bacterium]